MRKPTTYCSGFIAPYCEYIENALLYYWGFKHGQFSRYPSTFHILHVIFLHSTVDWGIGRQERRNNPLQEGYPGEIS